MAKQEQKDIKQRIEQGEFAQSAEIVQAIWMRIFSSLIISRYLPIRIL